MKPLQLLWRFVVLLVLTIIAFPSIAFATAAPINPTDTLASVRLSAITVQAIVSVFLPLIVGFVTNIRDSAFVKGLLQLVLNAVSAFIVQTTLVDGSVAFSKQTVMVFLVGTATSLVAYYNVWKSKGITSSGVPVRQIDGTVMIVPGSLSKSGIRRVVA